MASNRKSRKRRKARSAGPPPPPSAAPSQQPSAAAPPARGYERSRERDEAARAALKPLRPGERPTAVTVGAIAAAGLALANALALVFGYNSGDDTVSPGTEVTGTLLVTGVLALIAYGMWRARYWAVLGFEALLGVSILVAALSLTVASNWEAVALCLGTIAIAGPLFYKLVRAMARIQMPQRRPPQ